MMLISIISLLVAAAVIATFFITKKRPGIKYAQIKLDANKTWANIHNVPKEVEWDSIEKDEDFNIELDQDNKTIIRMNKTGFYIATFKLHVFVDVEDYNLVYCILKDVVSGEFLIRKQGFHFPDGNNSFIMSGTFYVDKPMSLSVLIDCNDGRLDSRRTNLQIVRL